MCACGPLSFSGAYSHCFKSVRVEIWKPSENTRHSPNYIKPMWTVEVDGRCVAVIGGVGAPKHFDYPTNYSQIQIFSKCCLNATS